MIDAQGDKEILAAQENSARRSDWIQILPRVSQWMLQTAFTLRDAPRAPAATRREQRPACRSECAAAPKWTAPWQPAFRGNHEGYTPATSSSLPSITT
jgi:hypothetical protein